MTESLFNFNEQCIIGYYDPVKGTVSYGVFTHGDLRHMGYILNFSFCDNKMVKWLFEELKKPYNERVKSINNKFEFLDENEHISKICYNSWGHLVNTTMMPYVYLYRPNDRWSVITRTETSLDKLYD